MNITFTQNIIERLLVELNITYHSGIIKNNWMGILCPFHNDTHFGNASINLESGVISCFACNQKGSIIKLYMQKRNCSYKECLELIGQSFIFNSTNYVSQKPMKEKEQSFKHDFIEDYITIDFNPNNYYYTKIRGYTKKFCELFNIKQCLGSFYDDYFLIPIIDKKKNIYTLEARKLMQREYIYKFLKLKDENFKKTRITPEHLFNFFVKKNGIVLTKDYNIIDKNKNLITNMYLEYLLKPKTLYPKNTDIDFTIWNINNLDRNKDLYVAEGLATIPKLYSYISKNCTSVFGTKVTDEQIKYLTEFKEKIIIIPDNDEASFEMIKYLNEKLNNIFVTNIFSEDTSVTFINDINNCRILEANIWLLENFKFYIKK